MSAEGWASLGSSAMRRRLWARLQGRAREPVWAGLGLPGTAAISCWVELRNVAPGDDAFEVPAADLLRLAEGPLELRAWLHVHPHGAGVLSARDRAAAYVGGAVAWPGVEWVVLAGDGSGTRSLPAAEGIRTRPVRDFCASTEV